MITLEVDSTNLQRQLKNGLYSEQSILDALNLIGHDFESKAKANITDLDAVDTGYLRRSIQLNGDAEKTSADEYEVEVIANTDYAPYVEYGTGLVGAESEGAGPFVYTTEPWKYQDEEGNWHTTSGFKARPFMRNAIDQTIADNTIQKILKSELKVNKK